jgi:hypothetical protein
MLRHKKARAGRALDWRWFMKLSSDGAMKLATVTLWFTAITMGAILLHAIFMK